MLRCYILIILSTYMLCKMCTRHARDPTASESSMARSGQLSAGTGRNCRLTLLEMIHSMSAREGERGPPGKTRCNNSNCHLGLWSAKLEQISQEVQNKLCLPTVLKREPYLSSLRASCFHARVCTPINSNMGVKLYFKEFPI